MAANARSAVGRSDDDVLKTTFYCVEEDQKVKVVLWLESIDGAPCSNIQKRYVLVLDVSLSMDNQIIKGDPRSLLERIKVFAKLFINHVSNETFISIVDFSDDARNLLPMTKMDGNGKAKALDIVSNLESIGMTNLSDGILEGLKATQSGIQVLSHDCILLFTDGAANTGILDANDLVNTYESKMKELNKANKVQLGVITIGDYRPYLLKEMSQRFSSDAFYWLHHKSDFEADMLIPVFLREITNLTDIAINLTCLNGTRFVANSASSGGLQGLGSDHTLQYFIYLLPDNTTRKISFTLDVSNHQKKGEDILLSKINYLDSTLSKRFKSFNLPLSLTPLIDLKPKDEVLDKPGNNLESLKRICAYLVSDKGLSSSWANAQLAYVNVMEQRSRQAVISTINQAIERLDENKTIDGQHFKEVEDRINSMKDAVRVNLGAGNSFYTDLLNNINRFADILQHIYTSLGDLTWIHLIAMESSLSMEMPTSTGVFSLGTQRIFMPPYVEQQMEKYIQVIQQEHEKPKKLTAEELNKIVKSRINRYKKAIKHGKVREITTRDVVDLKNKIKELGKLTKQNPNKFKKISENIARYNISVQDIEEAIRKGEIRFNPR